MSGVLSWRNVAEKSLSLPIDIKTIAGLMAIIFSTSASQFFLE
jgi:hypothetical protein